MKTRGLHSSALNIAVLQLSCFAVSWAGMVLFLSMSYGMSDAYHAPAWWFVALDKMLQLLEAPLVMVLRLLYHPNARF